VAKYKKKRARELQHDKFRDTTMSFFDRLGDALEGKGRTILYALGGVLLAAIVVFAFVKWNHKKTDEARQALGHAITIAKAPVMATAIPGSNELTFPTEVERAQTAIAEFEKVAAKYGDPYRTQSRYFIASNRLVLDRPKGIAELEELSKSNITEVAILAKFALAQARESDGKLDEAAQLYTELAKLNSATVTPETANLRLAKVYQKQGKKKEAADLLFNIVDAARKARDKDNQPIPTSAAAREAADALQKLDPDRYAQLPPETPPVLAG
jgi:predicted negative regulator of RcsB-dependent stress response